MLFFVFGFLNDRFHQHDNPWEFHMFHKKNLSLCINNGLSGKNHALFGQLYSYTLFGRCWASQTPPRGVSVVGVLKGDGSWILGTTAKDRPFQGRRPPGRESRTGEAGRFWAVAFFSSPKRKTNGFWLNPRFVLVGVWGALFVGGRGWGGEVSWVFDAVYFFTICLEVSQRRSPVNYRYFWKIFVISMYLPAFLRVYPLWGDGQCGCFFSKISMILSHDLGEDLKWS